MGLDMYALRIRGLTDKELAACVKRSKLPKNVVCILDSQIANEPVEFRRDLEKVWDSSTISVDFIVTIQHPRKKSSF